MTPRSRSALSFALALSPLLALSAALPAAACIHARSRKAGKPFKGKVLSDGYEGIVIHSEGREELILNVTASFEGDAADAGEIGWVLALPAVPDRYDASLSPQVFADASALMHSLLAPADRQRSGPITFGGGKAKRAAPKPPAIKVKKVAVGPYTVHQIEVLGEGAVAALNAWFKQNGYPERDPKGMAFFVQKRYTFLCLRVQPGKAQKRGFKKRSVLAPLRVSFAAAKPFFPLKFSSHAGTFPLSLYLFTKHPIDWEASAGTLAQLNVSSPIRCAGGRTRNADVGASSLQGELSRVYGAAVKEGFPKAQRFYFNHVQASRLNRSKNPIAQWKDDVWFELNRNPQRKALRAIVAGMLRDAQWRDAHVQRAQQLGKNGVAALREILVTSDHEYARCSAAWLLHKLESRNATLCAELLAARSSEGLKLLLGAMLLDAGDSRGFEPLVKRVGLREQLPPLSWLEGKPTAANLARGTLTRYTGKRFNSEAAWETWYEQDAKKLRWDRSLRQFRDPRTR